MAGSSVLPVSCNDTEVHVAQAGGGWAGRNGMEGRVGAVSCSSLDSLADSVGSWTLLVCRYFVGTKVAGGWDGGGGGWA